MLLHWRKGIATGKSPKFCLTRQTENSMQKNFLPISTKSACAKNSFGVKMKFPQ
jgi:hypothetical protein